MNTVASGVGTMGGGTIMVIRREREHPDYDRLKAGLLRLSNKHCYLTGI
jgi:hypothetical protein